MERELMVALCAALFFVTASFAGIMWCAVRASGQPPVPTGERRRWTA